MSNSVQNEIELSEALARCMLQDRETDRDGNVRELVCEVEDDAWEKAVEKPVDEVTFEPSNEDSNEDDPEQQTVLTIPEQVEEEIVNALREAGLDPDKARSEQS
jgi:hypothetical protein